MPNELMQVQAEDGSAVLMEIDAPDAGFGEVSFDGKVFKSRETLEAALYGVRSIALKALDTFRSGESGPDTVELEFGVKFKAEADSAVFARTASEGHIVVRLSWSDSNSQPVGRPYLEDDPQ